MTLTVETGTGSSASEAYASVSQADTRLAALGMATWAALSTAEKEQALRRATAYMEQAYADRWRGTRLLRDQALSWPRYGVEAYGHYYDSTSVPAVIVTACIDLALKAATSDLNPDLTRTTIREKVGPIETEYAPNAPEATRYRSIDQALAPFFKGGGAVALIRA